MGAFEDYQKARGKQLHPETEKIVTPQPMKQSDPWYKSVNWSRIGWITLGVLILGASGYAGYSIVEAIRNTQIEEVSATVPAKPQIIERIVEKPKIIYKDKVRYKTKWKTKVKWKTRVKVVEKPKVIYRDKPVYRTKIVYRDRPVSDPHTAALLATYRRRLKMMQDFYNKPLRSGERRKLVFQSSCPPSPVDNRLKPYQNLRLTRQ